MTYVAYYINVHLSIRPFLISILTFHFIHFSKTLIFALRFLSVIHIYKMKIHFFEAIACLQNGKNTFSKRFRVTKWKKQAFEVFFTFPKRKHDLIWSDSILMKWKNTFLKRFPCLQHKKHVFETLFMFTKWKKVLKLFFTC